MYYVYVLENIDKSLYIGYTSDLKRRLFEHNNKKGGRTTSRKMIGLQRGEALHWKLIYYEAYLEKPDAIGREKFLKGGSGRKYINKQLNHYLKKS
jgi:putative endonuclease